MKLGVLRKVPTLVFLFLLFSTILFCPSEANPNLKEIGRVDPDSETKPPTITMFSPKNQTTYNTTTLNLSFDANIGESKTAYNRAIMRASYKADWLANRTQLLDTYNINPLMGRIAYNTNYSCTEDLTGIPDGEHSIIVKVEEFGLYEISGSPCWFHFFKIDVYVTIQLNKHQNHIEVLGIFIDTEPPPLISSLSIEDRVYNSSSIPLNYTVSGVVSTVKYSLDGSENVTLAGNTTLTGLSSGNHTLRIYAIDENRHIETSQFTSFSITESQSVPIWLLTVTFIAVILSVCLLVYFFKRKGKI